jgi:hypothetical protein
MRLGLTRLLGDANRLISLVEPLVSFRRMDEAQKGRYRTAKLRASLKLNRSYGIVAQEAVAWTKPVVIQWGNGVRKGRDPFLSIRRIS